MLAKMLQHQMRRNEIFSRGFDVFQSIVLFIEKREYIVPIYSLLFALLQVHYAVSVSEITGLLINAEEI